MDRISTWWKKLLFPGGKLVFLLAVLGAVRFYLLRRVPSGAQAQDRNRELRQYRITGGFLMALAVTNAVKYRKFNSPVLSAAKMVNLTTALVSIFTLETAMLSSFGGSYQYEKLMTASTAGGVWTIVFCMAVYMVIHAEKQRNRSKPTS